ncbi:MAG: acyltransferase [Rhodospirillales bacterium]|nr:acyltransferase [Rhodospirillales bacterium]
MTDATRLCPWGGSRTVPALRRSSPYEELCLRMASSARERSGTRGRGGRLDFIDGLRAVAILTVFLTHATEQLAEISSHGVIVSRVVYDLNFGRLGVVTFFAISGFLIPSSLRGDPLSGGIRFLFSRTFRLFPAFLLSVVPSVVTLHWMSGKPFEIHDLLLNLTMVPRWFGAPWANNGYWTLEVEVLFYAITLFLFLGGAIRNQFVLACVLGGLFLVFYSSQGLILGGALNPALTADTFFLCLNLSCMFWGALCRIWWEGERLEPIPLVLFWLFTAYWLAWAPLFAAWHWWGLGLHDSDPRLLSGYGLGLGVFFVILATRLSLGRVMAWIGRVSYALYLFHSPVLFLEVWLAKGYLPFLQGQWLEVHILVTLAAGLLVSEAVHRWVERPGIRLGRVLSEGTLRGLGLFPPRAETAVVTRATTRA